MANKAPHSSPNHRMLSLLDLCSGSCRLTVLFWLNVVYRVHSPNKIMPAANNMIR